MNKDQDNMYELLKEQLEKHLSKEDMAHASIESKIDNLRDNHIHHISLDLGSLKKDMWWIKLVGGFVIVQAVGLVLAFFLK